MFRDIGIVSHAPQLDYLWVHSGQIPKANHRTKIAEEIPKNRTDARLTTEHIAPVQSWESGKAGPTPAGSISTISRLCDTIKKAGSYFMRFIVQRRSDQKYLGGHDDWVQSEGDAKRFHTEFGAEAFCFTQKDDDFNVFLRMPTGNLVRLNHQPLRPTGVPSAT